jgi:hypothetical protein
LNNTHNHFFWPIVSSIDPRDFLALNIFSGDARMSKDPHNGQKTPVRKAFGLKVRKRQYEIEMTQEELAEISDLHQTYVGLVERNISIENIAKLSKALGWQPRDLMPLI